MIFGVRFENSIPVVKSIYALISRVFIPECVVLMNSLYIEVHSDESDKYEQAIRMHQEELENGWIYWDNFLVRQYLSRILTPTPFLMYKESFQGKIPEYHELKWSVAYNQIDDIVSNLFTTESNIAEMVITLNGKEQEFPGIFNDPKCIPMI